MSQGLQDATPQTLIIFQQADSTVEALVVGLVVDQATGGCQLQLQLDGKNWQTVVQQHLFGEAPENRLEGQDLTFNPDVPVFIELALLPSQVNLPVSLGSEDVAGLADLFSNSPELAQADSWHLLQAWQAHALDPSIGGGFIKTGYRTIWSAPTNRIDQLKRMGSVSKTVVEALIENMWPVNYNTERQAFELSLSVGSEEYHCWLRADDVEIALTIEVGLSPTVTSPAQPALLSLLSRINLDNPTGIFELTDQQIWYRYRLQISPELLSQSFVLDSVQTALTIVYSNQPTILRVLQEHQV